MTVLPTTLSTEQQLFVDTVLEGHNVLVDACIGSGKTTAIQHLCNVLPPDKKVLYLTYNKLLKIDAKAKIKKLNVTVTNYHGFAFLCLKELGIRAGITDLIQTFNRERPRVTYDILILDEYQDIEQELADMLLIIKAHNPDLQIVAVGDMKQKIYDKTTLQIEPFIEEFLGVHKQLEFTQCFRLSKDIASTLGDVWEKKIIGVNDNCKVSVMSYWDTYEFLKTQNPSDILCLGARTGAMSNMLNQLETECPERFNKHTVFASITDSADRATEPTATSGIFTTFDSSKGLERKICVVFDFTEDYWLIRLRQPQQSYEILKNIFCVAASRGKERIIFVKEKEKALVSTDSLCTPKYGANFYKDVNISQLFDFKYKEHIEGCFNLLEVTPLSRNDDSEIHIKNKDGLIDLSPCIGIYQEARFFSGYDVGRNIALQERIRSHNKAILEKAYPPHTKKEAKQRESERQNLEEQILEQVALETTQYRYISQVTTPFVSEAEDIQLMERLSTIFTPNEEVQVGCEIPFYDFKGTHLFSAAGYCDVLKDDKVYELKFVQQLTHEHFLQCACYMVALNKKEGILWNTRTNERYSIKIPDRAAFLNAVAITSTKGKLFSYYGPKSTKAFQEPTRPKRRRRATTSW